MELQWRKPKFNGTMEDYGLIEIEEDEEDYDEGEYGEELILEGIMSPRDSNLISNAGEEEEEDDDDDEEDEDEEEDEDGEDYEEGEEGDELIPVEMTSSRVSRSISDGRTLQGAVVINEGLLDESNDLKSCEGKLGNQKNGGGDGGKEELNRGEIDGLFCSICFEAWTSGGKHQICCLPCGHIYGLSCIKKWLQRRRSSGRCPQCNSICTLTDVRVLYATQLCVADEELKKRVRSLEAKCAYLEQKDRDVLQHDDPRMRPVMNQIQQTLDHNRDMPPDWRGDFEQYCQDFEQHRQDFEQYRQDFEQHRQDMSRFRQTLDHNSDMLRQILEQVRNHGRRP